ncbi:hypothetical protein L6E12_10795 [Actinokineospora sp. PR83]|uniref:hypothetical protein n=1 Tax=Actinokineospora sp. PR83 TaxID=2884908 RepID=UPI001F2B291C|nr:hypothetical protein [Actinokineospora sp. PR83]MCG8916277.1 hypothetical protein [Actinokineospora sp. PR83]
MHTTVGLRGTNITSADCADSSFEQSLKDPLYRITEVLDIDGHCSENGSYGIELRHEPDDAVYCLDVVAAS